MGQRFGGGHRVSNIRPPAADSRLYETLEFGHFEFRFWREEIGFLAGHQKITGREDGFIPAPLLDASVSESLTGGAGINPSSRPVNFLCLNMKF